MKQIKEEIEFLEYIYQTAKLGQESVGRIIRFQDISYDIETILRDMISGYKKICLSIKGMLKRRNKEAIDISVLSKMATYMNIKLNMADIENDKDIAQIIIQSSDVTTDQITEKINETRVKNKSVLNIATRYIEFENENIRKLKKYIKL